MLLCIQTGRTLDDKDRMKFYNDDFYLKSGAEMLALFKDTPEAITNTLEIANRCNVSFEIWSFTLTKLSFARRYD